MDDALAAGGLETCVSGGGATGALASCFTRSLGELLVEREPVLESSGGWCLDQGVHGASPTRCRPKPQQDASLLPFADGVEPAAKLMGHLSLPRRAAFGPAPPDPPRRRSPTPGPSDGPSPMWSAANRSPELTRLCKAPHGRVNSRGCIVDPCPGQHRREGRSTTPDAPPPDNDREAFDCGDATLNEYLRRIARQNHESWGAKTFVAASLPERARVLGYYTISPGAIEFPRVPADLMKRLGRYYVPVFRLGRLAVDRSAQGQGLGGDLLMAAGERALAVAAEVGGVALAIDAKSAEATRWYARFGGTSPVRRTPEARSPPFRSRRCSGFLRDTAVNRAANDAGGPKTPDV